MKKKFLVQLLLSYLILLIIPISTGLVTYWKTYSAINSAQKEANLTVLNHMMEITNVEITRIDDIIFDLVWDPEINRLLEISDPKKGQNYSLFRESWKNLPNYQIASNLVLDYYIYFHRSGIIMSPDAMSSSLRFVYESNFKIENMNFTEWFDLYFGSYHENTTLNQAAVSPEGKKYTSITHLQSFPIGYPQNYKGTILVLLKEDVLQELLGRLKITDESWAFILDADGNEIASAPGSSEVISVTAMAIEQMSSSKGYFEKMLFGNRFHISYTVSELNGWIYAAGIPHEYLLSKIENIRNFMIIITLSTFAFCILLAIFLAYRTSKPLQDIRRILKEHFPDRGLIEDSGLPSLKGIINDLLENNERIEKALNVQKPLVYYAFFNRLMEGKLTAEEATDFTAGSDGLNMEGKLYLCLLMHIQYQGSSSTQELEQNQKVKRILMIETISKVIGNNGFFQETDRDTIVFFLKHNNHKVEALRDTAESFCKMIDVVVSGQIGLSVFFAGGNVKNDFFLLSQSYNEALEALNYREGNSTELVSWYHNIPKESKIYYYPLYIEQMVLNCVKSGDIKKTNMILDEIYEENFHQRNLNMHMTRNLLQEMRGTAFKLINQIKSLDNTVEKRLQTLEEILNCEHFFDQIRTIYAAFCESSNKNKKSHNLELIFKIKEYIKGSYSLIDMGLYKVASKYGLSEVYLSNFFSEQTGENFQNYLTRLRIAQAETLLTDPNLSINEISLMVGYQNSGTFRKAFHRLNGESPTNYRKKLL
jgi:two-component system response regulator YesN